MQPVVLLGRFERSSQEAGLGHFFRVRIPWDLVVASGLIIMHLLLLLYSLSLQSHNSNQHYYDLLTVASSMFPPGSYSTAPVPLFLNVL